MGCETRSGNWSRGRSPPVPVHDLVNFHAELFAPRWIGFRAQEAQTGGAPAGWARKITADRLRDQGADSSSFHHSACAQGPIGAFVKVSYRGIHLVLLVTQNCSAAALHYGRPDRHFRQAEAQIQAGKLVARRYLRRRTRHLCRTGHHAVLTGSPNRKRK